MHETGCASPSVVTVSEETGELHMCEKTKVNTPLHYYTYAGDVAMVESLIEAGECVNTVWNDMTPLYIAVHENKLPVIPVLLKHNANINATTFTDKKTALHRASCGGNKNLVEMLIENKANVNQVDINGVNALWMSAQHGHLDVCQYLISRSVDINKSNRVGISPLAVAVHNGHMEVVNMLLDAGCIVDLPDFAGCTPLYHAVKTGYRFIVQCLLKAGADPNQGNNAGDFPIHVAALHGNAPVLELLIDAGANVNVSTAFNGSPIYSAVQRQHMNAIVMLIKGGANVDVQNERQYVSAPLIEAVREDPPNVALIRILIQAGCNVDVSSTIFNTTPLKYSITNNQRSVVDMLLQADCAYLSNLAELRWMQDDPALITRVERCAANTRSLKRSCRRSIRAALGYGTRYAHKVASLHIPVVLKDFLMFKELDA